MQFLIHCSAETASTRCERDVVNPTPELSYDQNKEKPDEDLHSSEDIHLIRSTGKKAWLFRVKSSVYKDDTEYSQKCQTTVSQPQIASTVSMWMVQPHRSRTPDPQFILRG